MTADMSDRANYYPVPRHARLLSCLACAAVILDDELARELHGLLHRDHLDPPPTYLRAEVVRLRDEADVEMHAYGCPPNAAHQHRGERRMANRILNLIDKQREGQ